ncbi:unnamed protein product [Schistosoma curassoni]|uniref:RibD_C domain-containing protein n=1 Tax=Schistosoma curassoni TaxID=6186 RepID=A0A183JN38_9TREM|nr:unnamed protein product [Schistosoma curassoni]
MDIRQMKSGKSAGLDNIPAEALNSDIEVNVNAIRSIQEDLGGTTNADRLEKRIPHQKILFTGSLGIDLTSRSILGNMLPDAMIAYLENHPPEKFAEIFLGDFDSPEAIWNSEMR